MRFLILAILAAAIPSGLIAQTTTHIGTAAEIAALEKLNDRWLSAYRTKDVAALDEILADDFRSVQADGRVSTKTDLLKNVSRVDRVVTKISWENLRVTVWGDTAMVTARSFSVGMDKGQEFSTSNEYADIYVRTKRGWRAVGAHVIRSSEPAKSPAN